MGIGNHELIQFEEQHNESLVQSFLEKNKMAWAEHVQEEYNDYLSGGQ